VVNRGATPRNHKAQEGGRGLYRSMVNSSSNETSVGMYNLGIGSWGGHIGGLYAIMSQVWARPGLVSGRYQFEHAKWCSEEGGIHRNY
jgi:hypothetical protein